MDKTDSTALSSLGRQARDIIEAGTEWPELARTLDVDQYERDDKYHGTERGKPFRPMFLTYLYALVEDESLSGMHDLLKSNPDLVAAMGFDPDDLPSQSTFLPIRMEDRFSELDSELQTGSKEITQLAREAGSPIGNPVTDFDTDRDQGDISERTKNRLLGLKNKAVLDELLESGFFSFDLPQPENPIYDQEDLLTLETIAAIKSQAANDAGKTMGNMQNPDDDETEDAASDLSDDPFHIEGPSGETLLESIKKLSVDEIAEDINETLRKIYTRAKPKLDEIDRASNLRVAIDVTYVAYYGDEDGEWVVGAPSSKDYQRCHKFATATVVGENTHFVVAVEPLGNAEYTANHLYPGNEQKQYRMGDITRRLLDRLPESLSIRVVYADRGFYAADVLAALKDRDLYYVIPAPVRRRLKRVVDKFDTLKKGFPDDDRDVELYVDPDFSTGESVRGESGVTTVDTNLVVLPPDDETDIGGPQPFVTNLPVDDEIRLDRKQTAEKIERYSYRGGIETSYKSIKECSAWTSSKAFEVRWFHFAFGCVVYNMWLLVDLLTQARIGQIETRTKPRITLKRFLDSLEQQLRRRLRE